MKILLYGSKGWIGQKLLALLSVKNDLNVYMDVVIGKARVDVEADVEQEIRTVQPTHVISTIGRTHGVYEGHEYSTIDYLEQPGRLTENVRDNLFSPMLLAILSQKYQFHFTYLGTGCIFEYDEQHPFEQERNGFTEDSLPNFFQSGYSVVKGFTDRLMHQYPVLNLRIRMPISRDDSPRNFIRKITHYRKICSVANSMTVLEDFLPILIDMAAKSITGTFNFTNPGLISHNEILEMYREIVDPTFQWENFTLEEQREILAGGRSNNFLDTTKIEALYPAVPCIKDSVRNTLSHFVKKNEKIKT